MKYRTLIACHNEGSSQAKNSLNFHKKAHNFVMRGGLHLINTNGKHTRAQINSKRRIKAREASVRLERPVRTFDEETKITSRELMQVIKNKEVKVFKNSNKAEEEGKQLYISEAFNPHKAKRIYASANQREAGRKFVEIATEKFKNLKDVKAQGVLTIREETIEKVYELFKDYQDIEAIMVYIRNLWITYDGHLYDKNAMKAKVDHHIDLIIKNGGQRREEELLAAGKTPEEVYQTLRTVQGYNLYMIGILAERGGPELERYIRREVAKRLKRILNGFKYRMMKVGITTIKDCFLITRKHLPFLFSKKYISNRNRIIRRVRSSPFQMWEEYERMCDLLGTVPYKPPD